jgi:cell division protein FtsW
MFGNKKRNLELMYILTSCLLTSFGFLILLASQGKPLDLSIVAAIASFLFVFVGLSFVLRRCSPEADPFILPLISLLCGLGLIMIYRLNPSQASFQYLWVLLGGGVLGIILILMRDSLILVNYKYVFALLAVIFIFSTVFFGTEIHGARLWLRLGRLSFQPAELGKVFLVIFLASYLAEKAPLLTAPGQGVLGLKLPSIRHMGPLLLMWGLSMGLLVFQKDLGSSLLFFAIFLVMLYLATSQLSFVLAGLALFSLGSYVCYLIFPHVRDRVMIWIDPWTVSADKGYQIAQSLIAIASGGVSGSGLGLGHPILIPVSYSDFIFSAFAEELGLFGALSLIFIYLALIAAMIRISLSLEDHFSKLMVAGLASIIGLQSFVIMAGVSKLVPVTGVTLPFVSYGGSSLLANFILVALVLAASPEKAHGNR